MDRTPAFALALALLFFTPLAALGCRGVALDFTPYSSVDAPPAQVTRQAVAIRPGDRPHMSKAGPRVLGWIHTEGDPGDPALVERAQAEAARRGGTHILLRSAVTARAPAEVPLYAGQPDDEVQREGYVVLRVDPESWPELPPALRPVPLSPPK